MTPLLSLCSFLGNLHAARLTTTSASKGSVKAQSPFPFMSHHMDTVTTDSPRTTVIGFGSLLSETSSRLTFPDLTHFRLARVPQYRRVFAHPASIFFQRGLADLSTLQMSSLSVESVPGHAGFVAAVFDVPNTDMLEQDGAPNRAFLEREEEFKFEKVTFVELSSQDSHPENQELPKGLICTRSTDQAYVERWGPERFHDHFVKYGVRTIWDWPPDSGLRPCPVYLRHCYLAAKSLGELCLNSFLDETFLVDRVTTLRQYLEHYPEVLECQPPPELIGRYSG